MLLLYLRARPPTGCRSHIRIIYGNFSLILIAAEDGKVRAICRKRIQEGRFRGHVVFTIKKLRINGIALSRTCGCLRLVINGNHQRVLIAVIPSAM